MATLIKGSGKVVAADFKTIKWTGKTKKGNPIVIELKDAICMGPIDLTMQEKNDVVPKLTFTATYDNTNRMVSTDADLVEPWSIKYTGASGDQAADEIALGAGVVSVGNTDIALTRGGSHFVVNREFRNINADGDRGPVKDRVVMEGATATLEVNTLVFLTNMANLFPAITTTTTS